MIKGYFFNAKEIGGTYDRVYTADDFCNYLDLIVGDGVFMNEPTSLQVFQQFSTPSMNVMVGAGQMWIQGRKLLNDSVVTLPVPAADSIKDLYYGVIAYIDYTAREMNIELKSYGDAVPQPSDLIRNASRYEMMLAWLVVPKQATEIRPAYITDTRQNTQYCGTSTVITNTDKLVSGTNSLVLENDSLTIKDAAGEVISSVFDVVNGASETKVFNYSNTYANLVARYVKVGKSVTYCLTVTPKQNISSAIGAIGLPDFPHIEQSFASNVAYGNGSSAGFGLDANHYASFTGYQTGGVWKTQVNFKGSYTSGTAYVAMGSYICQ